MMQNPSMQDLLIADKVVNSGDRAVILADKLVGEVYSLDIGIGILPENMQIQIFKMVPDKTGKFRVPCKVAVHISCYQYTMAVSTVDGIGDVSKQFKKFRVIRTLEYSNKLFH